MDPGEACDDGNIAVGDGCGATCIVEPGYYCPGEPSVCTNTPAASCADPMVVSHGFNFSAVDLTVFGDDLGGQPTASCITDGTGRAELIFRADLQAGQALNVTDFGNADLVMKILDPGMCGPGVVCAASADFNETGPGVTYLAAAAGPVFVSIESYSTAPFSKAIDVDFAISACGDGIVIPSEGCDDGGLVGGDGCSTLCAVEPGYTCTGAPSVCVANPAASCADPIVVSDGFNFSAADITGYSDDLGMQPTASCTTDGTGRSELIFRADLLAGATLHVTDFGAADLMLKILDAGMCANGVGCAAAVDSGETGPGVSYTAPASGPVFVSVESYSTTPGSKDIDVDFVISPCGDGLIGPGEGCDDSDAIGGDGCSALCKVEPGYTCSGVPSLCIALPAASCADPIVVTNGSTYSDADITAYGDELSGFDIVAPGSCLTEGGARADIVFRADLLAGQKLQVNDYGSADLVIKLLGAGACGNGLSCVTAIDGSEDTSGAVYTATANETVYIVAEAYSATPGATARAVALTFGISSCGNGVVEANELCDDGNATVGDGCNAACVVEDGFVCTGSPSSCAAPTGATCGAPIVATDGFRLSGNSMGLFGDDLNAFPTATCVTEGGGGRPDIVFSVALAAGQTVNVKDFGSIDVVFKVLGTTCASGTACLASYDSGNAGEQGVGVNYTATVAETVYVVVESYGANPGATGTYDIRFDLTP